MLYPIETYQAALKFAARAHGGQKVPGQGYAYVAHVAAVCAEVILALENAPSADGALAVPCALLHDVLEDTPTGEVALRRAFGPAVCRGVKALTKKKELEGIAAMRDSLKRIRRQPREVWMVKMADRVVNLDRPPFRWKREKIAAYQAEARLILEELFEASDYLAARLWDRIRAYGAYTA